MEAQRTQPIYKAYCKPPGNADQDETFPNFFSFPPKIGDFIQSQTGRVYRVTSIMHTVKITKGKYGEIQSPRAILMLEKLSSGSTKSS